jgi:imidazolonepropionase
LFDLLVANARLYPMTGEQVLPAREDSLAVRDGKIVGLGVSGPARQTVDARGRALLPGFIDCHTHALWAGDRLNEHLMRLAGASYQDIAQAGGGILATVRAVRGCSEEELAKSALPRLKALLREGVTSVEIKSGYGLDIDSELKMLRAIARLGQLSGMDIHPTFLGAHAIPPGTSAGQYIRQVCDHMLPAVARDKLAEAVDIYVEGIAFGVEHMRELFEKSAALGLGCRVHAEQFSDLGASALAASMGAWSCDHLEYTGEAGAIAMGRSGSVAVLLPGAFYFLKETQKPPVGLFRRHNVPMALASDLNPGSSPIASLLTCVHMAPVFFGLTPDESLLGITRHAAGALGKAAELGTLEPGKAANFCLWDIADPRALTYQLGGLLPEAVYIRGHKHV